ncbi:DUF5336 domain-containing protein [Pseudofrankia inefficax]|uniref:Uncharacterized protein n=1 Tax=Pseudofrankia inefficax (strain DSM 45817 / CECT 9037 / DDB 130130 / EuI1c) TaxID=298654 RepID=E3J337_PSEI1|nr:DUF5336 domain-containing protein [Pseudofrankia inefficax]ADP82987.1 hypothetical protein FraEuI1c_4998 [Pseudofrankia inefficax]
MANMAGRGPATQDGPGTTATKAGRGKGQSFASHDVPIIGLGILGLIFSFLPWFGTRYRGYTYDNYGYGTLHTWTGSLNAWHSGALAWIPIVLMLVAAGLAAAHLLGRGKVPGSGASHSTAIAALCAVAALLIVIRWISLPHVHANYGYAAVASGARYGLILGLITSLVMTLLALRRLKASGERTHGQGHVERDASMSGYSGRGAERARVIDRDRQYAGRDDQPQEVGHPGGTTAERSRPDSRGGYGSEGRGGYETEGRGGQGSESRGAYRGPDNGGAYGQEEGRGGYGQESRGGYGTGPTTDPGAGGRDPGRDQHWDR